MSQIDWSKAPEGATHCTPVPNGKTGMYRPVFWRVVGNAAVECWAMSQDYTECDDHYTYGPEGCTSYQGHRAVPRPDREDKEPAWNGEGLPPIGTACEFYWGGSRWKECKVFAHKQNANHGTDVLIDLDGDWSFSSKAENFRPIKTAEQIAAEEREKAISDLDRLICERMGRLNVRELATAILESGYRKQESSQ